jgi:hypothetical protein
MRQYVVYRHGRNEANQRREGGAPEGPGIWDCKAKPEKMPVLRVDADSPEDACRRAAQSVPVAAGQYLSAEPADREDAHEGDLNLKAEALEAGPEAV